MHTQSSVSLCNRRELRTMAECIETLLAGDLPHLGDLLMQRLKVNLAQHLEFIPYCTPVQCSFTTFVFKRRGTSVQEEECCCCLLCQFCFNVTSGAGL